MTNSVTETSMINLQTVPVGTVIRVRALNRLVVGRRNKTAVRKGDITAAERLRDDGYAASYRVQPTVDGMGYCYTVRWNLEAVAE